MWECYGSLASIEVISSKRPTALCEVRTSVSIWATRKNTMADRRDPKALSLISQACYRGRIKQDLNAFRDLVYSLHVYTLTIVLIGVSY